MSDLRQFATPTPQFLDNSGVVLAGGKLYFYEAGTTTEIDTYPTQAALAALTGANTNPIVLDASGRPEVGIYMPADDYKIVLKTSADVTVWTRDNYQVTSASSFGGGLESSGGSIRRAALVNNQTGTSYTMLTGDRGKLVTFSNANAIAVTQPQANSTTFADGWFVDIENRGAGALTFTPSTSTVDGATSIVIPTGMGVRIFSDGTNYFTQRGLSLSSPLTLDNFSLSVSAAASALTIALKDRAGNDPTAGSPVSVAFRNASAATGDFSIVSAVSALSLVLSSGSTLGTANNTAFRAWVVLFNDGGTLRLGIVNCLTSTGIFPLDEAALKSSTAEGGAGAADSAGVIYTGTAVTSKAYRIMGYIQYNSGLATAGTWSSGPDVIQLFGPGIKRPGDLVNYTYTEVAGFTAATGITQIPLDNSIPQNTEGYEWGTHAHTPQQVVNRLRIKASFFGGEATNTDDVFVQALFQDSVANALTANAGALVSGTTVPCSMQTEHDMAAGTTSAITFKARASLVLATTLNINGVGGTRLFGGVAKCKIEVWEFAV
jgi:hypothetical protein